MNKLFLFLLFTFSSQFVFAQLKTYEKAKTEYAKKNLKGANKLIDKCLENPETKKDPRVRLLKSKIMFGIYKDPDLRMKYPDALKEALKYGEHENVIIEYDGEFIYQLPENVEHFKQLVKVNNKEGMDAFNNDKFPKALPIFKRSLSFGLDTLALVMTGECYWQMNLRIESLPYYKKASRIIYDAVLDSGYKVLGYHRLPFRKLGQYYIEKEKYDTAYVVVKNGREILPNDPVLTEYTYKMMRYALEKIPPSGDYLAMVRQSLKDFPTDSFLNHRENSIYIFLLNGMAKANAQNQFDSFVMVYANSKKEKVKLGKNLDLIKKYDIFAGQEPAVFLDNLYQYLGDIHLREACYATFFTLVRKFPETDKPLTLAQSVNLKVKKPVYAEMIFRRSIELDPNNVEAKKARLDYTLSKNKATISYYDLLPMIWMNDASAKDYPKDAALKQKAREYRLRLMEEAIDSGDFIMSRSVFHECSTMYPDLKKTMDAQWKKIITEDFRYNYYGTRINPSGKHEAGVPEYKWTGSVDQCAPGKMKDSLVGRLERRINYFRRTAGLTEEIVLTDENNENCEIAALMCEANKSMSHEPNDGWRCFIPAGFDALKLSILSKDGNPAIAVTAAMGQNHATVGNRRWLLYPYAQLMGIGTSNNYTSILAVDNSNMTDTVKYKSQAITWPPASYVPKMMVYKKWSFTLDQDLKGAVVTMKNAKGENIPVKQEALADGYGLNTLVWEPEINTQSLADEDRFMVTVKLTNAKVYNYTVVIADIKLQ